MTKACDLLPQTTNAPHLGESELKCFLIIYVS